MYSKTCLCGSNMMKINQWGDGYVTPMEYQFECEDCGNIYYAQNGWGEEWTDEDGYEIDIDNLNE